MLRHIEAVEDPARRVEGPARRGQRGAVQGSYVIYITEIIIR
jgi:hypothetical protein